MGCFWSQYFLAKNCSIFKIKYRWNNVAHKKFQFMVKIVSLGKTFTFFHMQSELCAWPVNQYIRMTIKTDEPLSFLCKCSHSQNKASAYPDIKISFFLKSLG